MSFKPKLDSEASQKPQNKLGRYSDHKVSLYGSYPVYCQEVSKLVADKSFYSEGTPCETWADSESSD